MPTRIQRLRLALATKALVRHVTKGRRRPSDRRLHLVASQAPYRPHRVEAIDLISDPGLLADLGTRSASAFADLENADWRAECGRALSKLSHQQIEEASRASGREDLHDLADRGHSERAESQDRAARLATARRTRQEQAHPGRKLPG